MYASQSFSTAIVREKYEPVMGWKFTSSCFTQTKIFCAVPPQFGAPPTQMSVLYAGAARCTAGLNKRAVEFAVLASQGAELPGPRDFQSLPQELFLS